MSESDKSTPEVEGVYGAPIKTKLREAFERYVEVSDAIFRSLPYYDEQSAIRWASAQMSAELALAEDEED